MYQKYINMIENLSNNKQGITDISWFVGDDTKLMPRLCKKQKTSFFKEPSYHAIEETLCTSFINKCLSATMTERETLIPQTGRETT